MERIISNKLSSFVGKEVLLKGFLHSVRKLGSIAFLILRDRGGIVQCVIEESNEIEKLSNIYTGSILQVNGIVAEMKSKKTGKIKYELQKSVITVLNAVKYALPLDISKEDLNCEIDTLLDNRVITLRHPKQSAIFKIYANAMRSMREVMTENEFTEISSAKIEGFPAEGGADCFKLDYFGREVYLAQSPQLPKQIMCGVYERVFEIGRVYRAEKSNTSRHMSEINMFDIEMTFLKDHEDLLCNVEKYFTGIVNKIWDYSGEYFEILNATKPVLADKFPRITCKELHELYFKETGIDIRETEKDVAREEEVFITEYSKKNWGSEAVFITEFPWSEAKFYHHKNVNNSLVADRADLIFRGVEIATVPLREVRYDVLIEQMKEKKVDPSNEGLKAYLNSFKYGMPPLQGGFGFGIARFVQKLIGLNNVKEAELFPRDMVRVAP